MKKYLIQGKYTAGRHEGKTFMLIKGGYVANDRVHPDDCYNTRSAAQMVATKKNRDNKISCSWSKYAEPTEYSVAEFETPDGWVDTRG